MKTENRPSKKQKIMSNKTKVKQVKQSAGLLTCIFEHAVESTTASFKWEGPKMNVPNRVWWDQVMAFFEWSQREHRSEAQVRVFVNPTTREWQAWAFPQKGKLGMATTELPDHPQFSLQRPRFGDDWTYYGTIHHHCGAGAFQSGTDSANEIVLDGLHITIGKIGSARYEIDARVYQSRFRLNNVRLDTFWDVSELKSTIPAHLKSLLPVDVDARLAAFEMCVPPLPETTFPEIWKENYIIEAPPVARFGMVPSQLYTSFSSASVRTYLDRCSTHAKWDSDRCRADMKELIKEGVEVEGRPVPITHEMILDMADMAQQFSAEDLIILDLMFKHDLTPDKFMEMAVDIENSDPKKELKKELSQQGLLKEVGLPGGDQESTFDYEGGNYYGFGSGHGLGG